MHFRWSAAKNGFQEFKYVETEAPYKKAANPIPGARYYFNDMYKVTYARGRWPFINKVRQHVERKFVCYTDNK